MIRILFITLFCPLILFGQNQEKAVFTGYVHFDFDKTEILPEAAFLLDSLGGVANPVEQFRFQITAHTDSIGNLAYNRDLSERRAKSVADVLVAKGISSEKISFSFEGETQPKTSNQTETGRQQNRRAKVELFKTPPPRKIEVFGTVTDDSTSEMLQAEILVAFRADSTKTTTEEGAYNLSLSKGGKYTLTCTTPGYFYQAISDTVLILPKQGTRRVEINFTLSKLKKGRIIKLENIYFVGNEPTVLPTSVGELKSLLKMMQTNPDVRIEIRGHVNYPSHYPQPIPRHTIELSHNRAKTVYHYLLRGGIAEDRMEYQGYGNTEMVYPHSHLESEMRLNRRVEVKVL